MEYGAGRVLMNVTNCDYNKEYDFPQVPQRSRSAGFILGR